MSELDNFLHTNIGYEVFEPGLARISQFIEADREKLNSKIITIGGTNGKGECSYTLGKLFQRDNFSYGLWSSPHLESVSERFEFNGELIGEDELLIYCQEFFIRMNNLNLKLSYYEFLFAVFIHIAVLKNPQYLILEVGLGGRLDAVNSLDTDICAITSISRDHQEYLGNSFKSILNEKFLISRRDKPLITAFKSNFLNSEVEKLSASNGAKWVNLYDLGVEENLNYSKSNRLISLEIYKRISQSKNLPSMNELMSFSFRGRFDRIFIGNKEIVFCGAHNLDGLRQMFSFICEENNKFKSFVLLASFSKRSEVDLGNMIKLVQKSSGLFSKIRFTQFEHIKAASLANTEKITFQKDWKKIINEEDKLFVTGSYYFIGEVKNFLHSFITT